MRVRIYAAKSKYIKIISRNYDVIYFNLCEINISLNVGLNYVISCFLVICIVIFNACLNNLLMLIIKLLLYMTEP